MANLDIIRRDALNQRLRGVGGNRIHWTAEHKAYLERVYMSAPASTFHAIDDRKKETHGDGGLNDLRTKLMGDGTISASGDTSESLNFIWRITSPAIDLMGDSVKTGSVNTRVFQGNPLVLPFHDSSRPPVAKSSMPWVVNGDTLAKATFPPKGVSKEADETVALVRAGYLRGASIGFVPIKFSLSKDPARPLGLDFHEILLLEWSVCSIPACSPCLMVGPAAEKRAPRSHHKTNSTRDERKQSVSQLMEELRAMGIQC